MTNYLSMDRASEAAARDLAEVRKLIEGMSAFVGNQAMQQQQQQQQQHTPTSQQQSSQNDRQSSPQYPTSSPATSTSQSQPPHAVGSPMAQDPNAAAFIAAAAAAAAAAAGQSPAGGASIGDAQLYNNPQQVANGVVVQVNHLMFNRVLYFQLTPDATIEPLITGLRLSFNDDSISGMVLQYKGFDGLWKCLLNRDDSLRRILKQGLKSQTVLQMRVPREQDLLSSGYTDRRLLALTKPGA